MLTKFLKDFSNPDEVLKGEKYAEALNSSIFQPKTWIKFIFILKLKIKFSKFLF